MVQRRRDGFDILSGIESIFGNCCAALKPDAIRAVCRYD
jgi:hypothetical protein